MNQHPAMWATFCDDIRQEVGNKLSYMGVYGPDLIVPSFPATLPKLCCVFNLRIPFEQSPKKKIAFRLQREDDVIFEAEITPPGEEAVRDLVSRPDDSPWVWISFVAQLANFEISEPALLRARALIDDEWEVRGGALRLQAASQRRSH